MADHADQGKRTREFNPEQEVEEARRQVAAAESRLARHEGRPGGPHPHTRVWLARARRRLDRAEERARADGVPPGAWTDAELQRLVDAYAAALRAPGVSGASVLDELRGALPGRTPASIEHRLGWIGAIVEEEGLAPLVAFPARPGYPDRLRTLVARTIVRAPEHAGRKYGRLTEWLRSSDGATIDATFEEIEAVLGIDLPPSCRRHAVHWYSAQGSAVARAIHAAGWRAGNVHLTEERLTFHRAP